MRRYSAEKREAMAESFVPTAEQLNKFGTVRQTMREEQTGQPESHVINNGSYVRVEPNEMTAWLYLNPPFPGEGKFSSRDILNFLEKNGVVRGYHTSNIAAMAKKGIYEREIKVAFGKNAVEGIDGYYEYRFKPVSRKEPEIREDGSVDYTSMSALQNVHKGDVIAVYHRAVQGEVGYSVRGKETKPKPAKELAPLRGKGISNQLNPDVYVAEQEGKIELKDNKVDIKNVHEVYGDVDLITGKIEFYGDVVISGNVSAGVIVRAGRNIVIKGTVEAVNMYAGGDIVLERGIQGGKKAKITAKGNVYADFIEHAEVNAKGSVFANSILNSQVSAEEKVIATGKKGIILGGYVHGLQGIEAGILGNDAEIRTMVHAGYEKETYENYIGNAAREEEAQESLRKTVDSMADILRMKRLAAVNMSIVEEHRLAVLNKQKDECFAKLDEIRQEKEILAAQIEKGKGAKVITEGAVYRGVIIGVEDSRFMVEEKTSCMQYEHLNGMVEASVRVL